MKLSDWAQSQGISYITAYRWFKSGKMPVPTYQTESGTILVQDQLPITGFLNNSINCNSVSDFVPLNNGFNYVYDCLTPTSFQSTIQQTILNISTPTSYEDAKRLTNLMIEKNYIENNEITINQQINAIQGWNNEFYNIINIVLGENK